MSLSVKSPTKSLKSLNQAVASSLRDLILYEEDVNNAAAPPPNYWLDKGAAAPPSAPPDLNEEEEDMWGAVSGDTSSSNSPPTAPMSSNALNELIEAYTIWIGAVVTSHSQDDSSSDEDKR